MGVLPVLVVHPHRGRDAPMGVCSTTSMRLLTHLAATVDPSGLHVGWVHGLPSAISPAEAGARASWTSTVQFMQRQRLGAFVLRNLARTRRRLRVRPPEPVDVH